MGTASNVTEIKERTPKKKTRRTCKCDGTVGRKRLQFKPKNIVSASSVTKMPKLREKSAVLLVSFAAASA
jgi:hypothetical protein